MQYHDPLPVGQGIRGVRPDTSRNGTTGSISRSTRNGRRIDGGRWPDGIGCPASSMPTDTCIATCNRSWLKAQGRGGRDRADGPGRARQSTRHPAQPSRHSHGGGRQPARPRRDLRQARAEVRPARALPPQDRRAARFALSLPAEARQGHAGGPRRETVTRARWPGPVLWRQLARTADWELHEGVTSPPARRQPGHHPLRCPRR